MMRMLGIDPGLRVTGYGCVERTGAGTPRIIEAGVFRLIGSNMRRPVSERLAELNRDLRSLLERVRPDAVAVESLFAHARHPGTAILMGHARGVVLLAIEEAGLPLVELRPAEVKRSVSGWGRAAKGQMQRVIQATFALPAPLRPHDVADALAIALCALDRSSPRSDDSAGS
jgi:crossover junction endodeoxyribonuclease RuvC